MNLQRKGFPDFFLKLLLYDCRFLAWKQLKYYFSNVVYLNKMDQFTLSFQQSFA